MPDVELSESAVANLRFRIKGFPLREQDLPAFRELVAAGIAEPVEGAGPGFRFTPWGLAHRDEILERESDRIERERYAPPDGELSESAMALLGRLARGRVAVEEADRPAFRELAAARVITFGSSFAGGPESAYRFTYWGWELRHDLLARTRESA